MTDQAVGHRGLVSERKTSRSVPPWAIHYENMPSHLPLSIDVSLLKNHDTL